MQVFVSTGENLTLSVDATQHGGAVYDCVALTNEGSFSASVSLRVAPGFEVHPTDQRVSPGDNVTLTCRAESYPAPTYQWEKFNTSTQSFEQLMGQTTNQLQFTNIQGSEFGVYRCVATAPMISQPAYSNNATLTG